MTRLTSSRNGKPDVVDREMTLAWLHDLPGYRELIRGRVSEARKRQYYADEWVRKQYERRDVDRLGRDVEGCG